MEPITLTLFIGTPILVVGAALYVGNKRKGTDVVAAARQRSKDRAQVRAFADTVSDHSALGFANGIGVHVTEDAFNHRGLPLSAEQIKTIGIIFDGYHPPVRKNVTHNKGATAPAAAGVPTSMTAFDQLNTVDTGVKVEYIDSEYQWPEAYIRD